MSMPTPTTLLRLLAEAVLTTRAGRAADDAVEATPELVEAVWSAWRKQGDELLLRAEVQALARTSPEEIEPAVAQALAPLAPRQSPEAVRAVRAYLVQVPAAVRRRCRRPADPQGSSLPAWLPLLQAADLLALLPAQTPWFAPGDKPWEVGGWELVELLEAGSLGETWLARKPDAPPAALLFLLHPTARQRLLRQGASGLDAVLARIGREARHPSLVELRHTYLSANPPCLEYEHVEGGDLAGLIRDWHATGGAPDYRPAATLVLQLAEALGHVHRLQPPLVHRGLCPSAVRVRQAPNGRLDAMIAHLGLADLLPRTGDGRPQGNGSRDSDRTPYVAPEQRRGAGPDPREDVYALGILWYQLLCGSLEAGRPGGSQWRRRLGEGGMPAALIELLEACFEDDPHDRPADASALAERLAALLEEAGGSSAPATRPPRPGNSAVQALLGDVQEVVPAAAAPSRGRSRRADVWQIFDELEKPKAELATTLSNAIGLKLVLIPAGAFQMGASPDEAGRRENEEPRREVTLTHRFYLGVYPVTQEQYQRVVGKNPSRFGGGAGGGPEFPVDSVSWEEAAAFCRRLSELPAEKQAGRVYRLPTEAEWEYACRAGTTTTFCYGPALNAAQANFDGRFPYAGGEPGRSVGKTTRVGTYPANNFGLYDMHGDVWEWCADWLDALYYARGPRRDPPGPDAGSFRVLRGGSWRNHAVTCRAAYRNGLGPQARDSAVGFRVALDVGS
jgi:formylglycine-generating enzyme required for sulfatase activity